VHAQEALPTRNLAATLWATLRDAECAVIDDARYLALFGIHAAPCRARDVWDHLVEVVDPGLWQRDVELVLRHGTLARRIVRALRGRCERPRLHAVYAALCDCLRDGRQFVP
jgi:carboxylate-amine ligase